MAPPTAALRVCQTHEAHHCTLQYFCHNIVFFSVLTENYWKTVWLKVAQAYGRHFRAVKDPVRHYIYLCVSVFFLAISSWQQRSSVCCTCVKLPRTAWLPNARSPPLHPILTENYWKTVPIKVAQVYGRPFRAVKDPARPLCRTIFIWAYRHFFSYFKLATTLLEQAGCHSFLIADRQKGILCGLKAVRDLWRP